MSYASGGEGWQPAQSLYAISSGGFWGLGLGQSNQKHGYLPEPYNDYIFAILAEELGFVGVCIYLFLYVLLVVRILWVASKARGYMGSYICIGAAAVFIFQGLENLGMCMGLLPVIGLTLPFLSYGGSSALSLFLLIGVVESVAAHRVKYYTERDDVL
jgi:cell division protein FtsW